ncbi:MAG: DEAD/DEAH box helicase family protein [Selenomonadaceae bacterium]|nr:DEAD/DEAH box helicase family protein [Selenomonadaceae bacterium]
MKISIRTTEEITPKIYAYTTPDVTSNDGWTKIGYTSRDVLTRIKEQLGTARIHFNLEWTGEAVFNGAPLKNFFDKDFHAYLRKRGIVGDQEWFQVTGAASEKYFREFKDNRGVLKNSSAMPYTLREEQARAVDATQKYFHGHAGAEFLWNAKPRFGKTLATYDLCKKIDAEKILIVTNRPAIAHAWYDDYVKFLGANYFFVSEVDALKGKRYVLSRKDFQNEILKHDDARCVEFVSLQDMKGSKYFGGMFDKLHEVANTDWDLLVVDEAHEGVDTFKTDVAFDQIHRHFTLHLSGTPFKALANNKFPAEAIFNWTYAEEQEKKFSFGDDEENPYAELPRLNLYTYQMSEIVRGVVERGVEAEGGSDEYAFDLNEFFKTDDAGKFFYEESVDKFLDALTVQKKFPFSTPELRDELRHTFWLLNRVDSARALAAKLQAHPTFQDYEIILAAGDGKIDDADAIKKSYDKVVEAIKKFPRTITLSVGQLTTGVTIPEWTGVLMLANMHSPALYVQAAFRAQNPCLFARDGKFLRKENAYVFDFDPARTLTIFESFANDLASDTSGGRGDLEARQKNIRTLLNFFPVIGEDDGGELIELDAEKVLSLPRRIRCVEVVRRGFMSDFLFQNISRVFNASADVVEIISRLPAVEEDEINLPAKVSDAKENLFLDDDGEISIPKEVVIGTAVDVFGEKKYAPVEPNERAAKNFLKGEIKITLDTAQEIYEKDLSKGERKKLERQLNDAADYLVKKTFKSHELEKTNLERERKTALKNSDEKSAEEINAEFDRRLQESEENFRAELPEKINDFMKAAEENTVAHVETKIQEAEKKSVEDDIRDHLRGFSRTIPSFLMAYGDDSVTLANFDKIIPDEVFKELTSISIDDFRYLRDVGKLFDEITFNDSVKEFLRLRRELADYFDEDHDKDIFDYIPPQKTNQIFTPRETVQKILALVEKQYPGCFDDPDSTFIDPYMKSGTFAAEVLRRLYRSPRLKEIFPDKIDRLRHIFAHQVFGLAPTEIIFRIAKNYILGFGMEMPKENFRLADALPAAKDDKLDEFLEEIYD